MPVDQLEFPSATPGPVVQWSARPIGAGARLGDGRGSAMFSDEADQPRAIRARPPISKPGGSDNLRLGPPLPALPPTRFRARDESTRTLNHRKMIQKNKLLAKG